MRKVLIANRGEIAVRIIRACHDLDLRTVAVHSDVDKKALHVLHADEAVCIGKAPVHSSYLKIPNILSACEITGADALHPGYGFLSENANFAAICESCGLNFIGPSSHSIALLGNKAKAKEIAKQVNCPVIPGHDGVIFDLEHGLKEAEKIGYPIYIKAVAGGGGRGVRIAYDDADFKNKYMSASTEAEACFGNSSIYLEKLIENPRHVEVQILADEFGNIIHLGERDCTIQRRRQKLIEESPCPVLTEEIRNKMGKAAIAVIKAARCTSAVTVEFLLDQNLKFYFMEVNTRIQVEHTVTEELTNIDLVQDQIRIAMGLPLQWTQEQINTHGHAFQFRINAENPAEKFTPSPGVLEYYLPPGGPNVRIDSGCYSGYRIPPYYDSIIAKLIVNGRDRAHTLAIAKRALREFHISGVHSTVPFHLYMLNDKKFHEGAYDLNYIDDKIANGCRFENP